MLGTVPGIQEQTKKLKMSAVKEVTFGRGRQSVSKYTFTRQVVGDARKTNRRRGQEGGGMGS